MRITIHEDTPLQSALAKLSAIGLEEEIELAAIQKAASDMQTAIQKLAEHGSQGELRKVIQLGSRKIEIVAITKSSLSLFGKLLNLFE